MTAGVPNAPILAEMQWGFDVDIPVVKRLNWFLNVPAGVPFDFKQSTSLDYSLQLKMGIDRFNIEHKIDEKLADEVFTVSRDLDDPSAAEIAGIGPESDDDDTPVLWLAGVGVGGLAVGAIAAVGAIRMRRKQ